MSYEVKKAAVLGAGVMGAAIAAHLANAGIECLLLDIIPFELSEADQQKGLTREDSTWRNSFAAKGLASAVKAKPASFYSKKNAALVTIGNFEDDLDALAEVDWVIEVVIENLQIKQELLAKVAALVGPTCVISTNTSGLPIKDIAANLPATIKERFLGIHFFNPPRYMKLVEIIPGESTRPEIVEAMTIVCEERLGKGVVICKDVPNFIANRIGVFDIANAIRIMTERNLSVPELDAIIGKGVGRPGSSICGTMDLVGIDTGFHVMNNLHEAVKDDEMRDFFIPQDFMIKMMENKWLGNKTRQGFYKKTKDEQGKRVKLALDYRTMEYVPSSRPKYSSLEAARKAPGGFGAKLRLLFAGSDVAAEVVREYLCRNFIYAANRIPEICDTVAAIDNTMKWGYNHKMGPFELWDLLGVEEVVKVMKGLKLKVPKKISDMLKRGHTTFYRQQEDGRYCYDFATQEYIRLTDNPKIILLPALKERQRVVASNPGASLIDLGDGVACLEFHTKMNAIDGDVGEMIYQSCDIVERDFLGLVVANHGQNFSVGANLFQVFVTIQKGDWDILDKMIHDFQYANMRMKFARKPVVVAPAGMALGGGCEISMHGARCQPCGETYMGLVEVGVGVIPAGGGTKEMMVRCTEGIPDGTVANGLNLQTLYQKAFENIGMAKVATSAVEAMELGFIRKTDTISMNRDLQINDAKNVVLGLSKFYQPPKPALVPVMGDNFRGMVAAILHNMRAGNYISDYDQQVAGKLARVLSGGDCAEGTYVSEAEILDLEREAFLSLCGEAKTQDRMMYMLKNGKPLRN
ncbi:MAG: enoyl-CoA hydratase/isomerase family protein [Deltaproteobacteria bacterium]|nr:enoyl-CoA hydratase/isomerase family protein [Candidatus Anaeroferrophillus wilburensis]MBN2888748.1 enoyl-CoA hydratase/isomerase family protein [Deltaproteobacteria bacterium]